MAAPLILVLVLLVGGAIAYVAWLVQKKHREALQRYAASKGWSYAPRDDSMCDRFDGHPFGTGHSRKAQNVMTGPLGDRQALVFDYQYSETHYNGQNRSETTYRFSVYALSMPCPLPTVSVAPEGFFSKVGHAIGMHDVELESEEFNRQFRLTADDDKLAYDLISARTMELLLSQPDVHVRTEGGALLCFDRNWLDPARAEARLNLLATFLDLVPSFVWHDRGVNSPTSPGEGAS